METEEICAVLRRWPREAPADRRSLARESAEHCREVFGAKTVVLAIEEAEEPWVTLAIASEHDFRLVEAEDLDLESIVEPAVAQETFAAIDDQVWVFSGRVPRSTHLVHPSVGGALGNGALLSVPLGCDRICGRVFISEPAADPRELVTLAEAVGLVISSRFEATSKLDEEIHEAVEEERVRVARDLHDGLLQSFTGVVLQLETAHSMMESQPDAARRMITDTQAMIMADQRELRRFVEQLRPRPGRRETAFDFHARLEDLRARFAKQWGMKIAVDVADIDPLVSAFLGQETFRLIHEAVTNSAKHGRASDVSVGVRTSGSEMHIEVTDNGTGFPFHGRLTLERMRESGEGPTVLAERVTSLNGNLIVDSTDSGATVSISVPLGWGGA